MRRQASPAREDGSLQNLTFVEPPELWGNIYFYWLSLTVCDILLRQSEQTKTTHSVHKPIFDIRNTNWNLLLCLIQPQIIVMTYDPEKLYQHRQKYFLAWRIDNDLAIRKLLLWALEVTTGREWKLWGGKVIWFEQCKGTYLSWGSRRHSWTWGEDSKVVKSMVPDSEYLDPFVSMCNWTCCLFFASVPHLSDGENSSSPYITEF